MAYDALNPGKDEEKDPQSQYADLLAPAGGAAPAAGTPAATPAPRTARPGFVNFDRIFDANKDTTKRMQSDARSALEKQQQAITQGATNLQGSVASEVATKGVPSAQGVTSLGADGAQAKALSELYGSKVVSRDEAAANAGAKYGGPSQGDIDSRYAPLLARANQMQPAAPMARLDNQLLNQVGGIGADAYVSGTKSALDRAYKAASQSVADGTKVAGDEASKWQALLNDFDTNGNDVSRGETANRAKAVEAEKRANTEAFGELGRPKGADYVAELDRGFFGGGRVNQAFGIPPEKHAQMAQLIDKLSDAEFRELVATRDTGGYAQKLRTLGNLHGVHL